jgi:hypothetical protein
VAEPLVLLVAAHVEDDRTAVLADEVVMPDGEASAAVGHVLVEQIVGLAGAHPGGRERVDEVAT